MSFELRRVILFTGNLEAMAAFYGGVLGLAVVSREDGWIEYDAGPCRIALHKGKSALGTKPPKLVFYAPDVEAARALLVERGVKMGKVLDTGAFKMCDFKDPDGNSLQISGRV